ncbi:hypothetical protein FEM33_16420 [Dyadobacter flavalbus]|uniref:Uncharacterized protein n=1 Tax=Dyadobacter flavalbus TaxID=2579942 RepID=A0A5M8QUH0_9BACT|nr:hypothetical protein [Dyadobacter flavalbus]KAA6438286.1 hypothetical protein FEM33_16420 [Dyadobacter flavalbus]
MYSPQIDLKSAAIASALSRMEGIFQNEETPDIKLHYTSEKDSELSVYANFIQENTILSGQILNVAPKQEPAKKLSAFNEMSRKRFFNILRRAAKAQDGISRQERLFVQQFWSGMTEMDDRKI